MLRILVLASSAFDRVMLCCLLEDIRPVEIVATHSPAVAAQALDASPAIDLVLVSGMQAELAALRRMAGGRPAIHAVDGQAALTAAQMRLLRQDLSRLLDEVGSAQRITAEG